MSNGQRFYFAKSKEWTGDNRFVIDGKFSLGKVDEKNGLFCSNITYNETSSRYLGTYRSNGEARAAVEGAVVVCLSECYGCSRCGRPERYVSFSYGCETKMCHHCRIHEDWISRSKDNKNMFVAKGRLYTIDEKEPAPGQKADFCGYGGTGFRVKFLDGRPERITHNLWTQGNVPNDFKGEMKDNAELHLLSE